MVFLLGLFLLLPHVSSLVLLFMASEGSTNIFSYLYISLPSFIVFSLFVVLQLAVLLALFPISKDGAKTTLLGLLLNVFLAVIFLTLAAIITTQLIESPVDAIWPAFNPGGGMFLNLQLTRVYSLLLTGILLGPILILLRAVHPSKIGSLKTVRKRIKLALVLVVVLISFGSSRHANASSQAILAGFAASESSQIVPLNSNLRIHFTEPVQKNLLQLSVRPDLAGDWIFEDESLNGYLVQTATFQAEQPLSPGDTYTVFATGLKTLLSKTETAVTYVFEAETAPIIQSLNPTTGTGEIPVCVPLSATFDRPLSDYWQADLRLEPAVEGKVQRSGSELTFTPVGCLEQGRQYAMTASLSLDGRPDLPAITATSSFTTAPAPEISTFKPQGQQVHVDEPLSLSFTKEMIQDDPGEQIVINPPTTGAWQWQDEGTTLVFTPTDKLQHGTKYSVVVKAGLPAVNDGYLAADKTFSFITIGAVQIVSATPKSGSSKIPINQNITIKFDQEVDHASATSLFKISPEVPGQFSWQGNSLTFTPSRPLEYLTDYQVKIGSGLLAVYGTPLPADWTMSWQTEKKPPPPLVPVTFGQSTQGKPITGYITGSGPEVLFLFGAIHGGKEKSSGLLLERLVSELKNNEVRPKEGKTLIILPVANPDGYSDRTDKLNANGVNLNINFGSQNWQPRGGDANDPAGSEPFSEIESRVIRDIVSQYGVDTMVSYHAVGSLVNPEANTASKELATWYAKESGYRYYDHPSWDFTGTATVWFAEKFGGAAITVELASYTTPDWSRHEKVIYSLISR